jgi:voltage-gated potassium channel
MRERIQKSLDTGPLAVFIQLAIVLSCLGFTLETVPSLAAFSGGFSQADQVFTVIFAVELGVRIAVAPKPLAYLTSFFGIIDLIAVLPGFVGVNAKGIRAVRLIRMLKLLRDERANRAIRRLATAWAEVKGELLIFGFIAFLVVYLAAVGIYFCEHPTQPERFSSIPASMWWALATLTTVGYGDAYPITVAGKLFAAVVILVGIGIVAIPTGLFASSLYKNREKG